MGKDQSKQCQKQMPFESFFFHMRCWYSKRAIGILSFVRVRLCIIAAPSLEVELCAAPMTAFLVPADAVACAQADPVGHGAVLFQLLRILLLDGQGREASHLGGRFRSSLLIKNKK